MAVGTVRPALTRGFLVAFVLLGPGSFLLAFHPAAAAPVAPPAVRASPASSDRARPGRAASRRTRKKRQPRAAAPATPQPAPAQPGAAVAFAGWQGRFRVPSWWSAGTFAALWQQVSFPASILGAYLVLVYAIHVWFLLRTRRIASGRKTFLQRLYRGMLGLFGELGRFILSGHLVIWKVTGGVWSRLMDVTLDSPLGIFAALPMSFLLLIPLLILTGVLLLVLAGATAADATLVLLFTGWLAVVVIAQSLALPVMVAMRVGQYAWLAHRRITHTCPRGECSYRGMPLYVCPNCGTEHRALWPSFFGLVRHQCPCGWWLPAASIQARSRLVQRCAGILPDGRECRQLLTARMGVTRVFAVIGGPEAGKSSFVLMLLRRLLGPPGASDSPIKCEIEDPEVRRTIAGPLQGIDRGIEPDKTLVGVPHAISVKLSTGARKPAEEWLYLYDGAGDEYTQINEFRRHEYLKHLNGFVLLVDPFSFDALQSGGGTSVTSLHNVVAAMVGAFSTILGVRQTQRCRIPLAVVITKADEPVVRRHLGDIAQGPPDEQACREALVRWGAGSDLDRLEERFVNIRYFACSALGRRPQSGSGSFRSHGLLEPLIWLVGSTESGSLLGRLLASLSDTPPSEQAA